MVDSTKEIVLDLISTAGDVQKLPPIPVQTRSPGTAGVVFDVSFSNNLVAVVTGGCMALDVKNLMVYNSVRRVLVGNLPNVNNFLVSIDFNGSESLVSGGRNDGSVFIIAILKGVRWAIKVFKMHTDYVGFSPQGEYRAYRLQRGPA